MASWRLRARSTRSRRRTPAAACSATLERASLWIVQTPQVFRGAALRGRSRRAGPRARLRRRPARRGRRWRRARRRGAASESQDHDAARPARSRSCCSRSGRETPCAAMMLTDYHTHLRPDDPDASAERVLHGGQRRRYLERGRRARASRSSGFSEHVYRFRAGARRLAPPVLGGERHRRPRRLRRVRAGDEDAGHPVKLGHRDGLRARARERDRGAARGPAVGLRDRLGALHRRPGRRPRGLRRLARVRSPTRCGASTSRRSATRPRAGSSTCSPIPTS